MLWNAWASCYYQWTRCVHVRARVWKRQRAFPTGLCISGCQQRMSSALRSSNSRRGHPPQRGWQTAERSAMNAGALRQNAARASCRQDNNILTEGHCITDTCFKCLFRPTVWNPVFYYELASNGGSFPHTLCGWWAPYWWWSRYHGCSEQTRITEDVSVWHEQTQTHKRAFLSVLGQFLLNMSYSHTETVSTSFSSNFESWLICYLLKQRNNTAIYSPVTSTALFLQLEKCSTLKRSEQQHKNSRCAQRCGALQPHASSSPRTSAQKNSVMWTLTGQHYGI